MKRKEKMSRERRVGKGLGDRVFFDIDSSIHHNHLSKRRFQQARISLADASVISPSLFPISPPRPTSSLHPTSNIPSHINLPIKIRHTNKELHRIHDRLRNLGA